MSLFNKTRPRGRGLGLQGSITSDKNTNLGTFDPRFLPTGEDEISLDNRDVIDRAREIFEEGKQK